ncbi:S41 family peptidase [Desertibacillus haloalkaliphilus]|uniref:S41 family peptidase n=1 Tax=Desertibacillus haloalkaliphilus TaxID=1328930 RepID=UPI001C277948|nr:S41 family peptidase [Desertibacillus haloalkaliphilus]MBU8905948.1 PDZ domain-containing protein [Desertibacillus haloalkaliphilus]
MTRYIEKMQAVKLTIVFVLCFLAIPSFVFAESVEEQQKLDMVKHLIETFYYEPVDGDVLESDSISEIVGQLDPYSEYLSYEDYTRLVDSIAQEFVGIGVEIEQVDDGLAIINVFDGGGADEAGVQPGDIIIGVEGVTVNDVSLEEALLHIQGEEGTKVQLDLYRPKDETFIELVIERKVVSVPVVTAETLGGNIGYIGLHSFSEESASEVKQALTELGEVDQYIFDLRYNAGGYLGAAQDVAGFFPSVGHALQIKEHDTEQLMSLWAITQDQLFEQPVSVLINEYSASASEIVAAAVKDYQAAPVFGQTSFGKGTMQELFHLEPYNEESDILRLTTAEFLSPAGKTINQVGVTPTVETEVGRELTTAHETSLDNIYQDYHGLGELTRQVDTTTFSVAFSIPIDWESITESTFEFMEVGGQSVPLSYDPISETEIGIELEQPLEENRSYRLYVHPEGESEQGVSIESGYYVSVEVN